MFRMDSDVHGRRARCMARTLERAGGAAGDSSDGPPVRLHHSAGAAYWSKRLGVDADRRHGGHTVDQLGIIWDIHS